MAGETVKISKEKFRELRRRLFLTQDELGDKIEMSGGRVGTLEQLGGSMLMSSFRKLAEAAGMSPESLKKEIGDIEPDGDDQNVIVVGEFKSKKELIAAAAKAWDDQQIKKAAKKKQ